MKLFHFFLRTKKCEGDTAPQCEAKLSAAFDAWLMQRYPPAGVGSVDMTCNANPGRCDDPKEREITPSLTDGVP